MESPKPPTSGGSHLSLSYLLPTLALSLGLLLGYFLFSYFPSQKPSSIERISQVSSAVSLPNDAVLLEQCVPERGTLYIRPADIPQGPLYMVSNGEVIGIEYRLEPEVFTNSNLPNLLTAGIKLDHLSLSYITSVSDQYPKPYYALSVYKVKPEVEQKITCPQDLLSQDGAASDSRKVNESTSSAPIQSGAVNPAFPVQSP